MDAVLVLVGIVVGALIGAGVMRRREIAARRKTRVITRMPHEPKR